MSNNTYVSLSTQTLASNSATVTFSSIPAGYTDLVLVMNYAGSIAAEVPAFRVNGDTGANYSITHLSGNGSTTRSARTTSTTSAYIAFSSAFPQTLTANAILHFMNYSNTTTNKTVLIRTNSTNGTYNATEANVALWRSTAAINSITLLGTNGSGYYAGSTFSLYGIAAEPTIPTGVTGGTLYSDANYYYNVFTSSDLLSITSGTLTADILTIAGGGGSGGYGGGGGAGGVVYTTRQSLMAGIYSVTIGAGGSGLSGSYPSNGSNSQFSTITAIGGGYGGGYNGSAYYNGNSGGSGGGANWSVGSAGTGTSGQGTNGGVGSQSTGGGALRTGGGGGGAGSAGSGKNGGAGINTYASWATATETGVSGYYAGGGGGAAAYSFGGGGGGTGGAGGGGAGTGSNGGVFAGAVNTGSGAGSDGATTAGTNGGSGIIIVRYAK